MNSHGHYSTSGPPPHADPRLEQIRRAALRSAQANTELARLIEDYQRSQPAPATPFSPTWPPLTAPRPTGVPVRAGGGGDVAPPPQPQRAPRPPWWERDDAVTKVLATLGGIITVIGLTFMALLAYASGALSPETIVVLAALLCGGLAGVSLIVFRRHPAAPTAPALLVASTLGALADVWVAVFGVHMLNPAAGASLTVVICGLALWAAHLWNKQALAITVTALSPLFIVPVAMRLFDAGVGSEFFAGCVSANAICAFAVRWAKPWFTLQHTATGIFAIGILLAADQPGMVFALAVVGAAAVAILNFVPPLPSSVSVALSFLAVVGMPTLVLVGSSAALLGLGLPAVMLAGMAVTLRATGQPFTSAPAPQLTSGTGTLIGFRVAAATMLLSAAMLSGTYPTGSVTAVACTVGLAVATVAIVAALPRLDVPLVYWAVLLTVVAASPYAAAGWSRSVEMLWPQTVIIMVAGAAAVAACWVRRGELAKDPLITSGFGRGVVACAGLIFASSLLPIIARAMSPAEEAFMVGHVLISSGWMAAGVLALTRSTRRGIGLALALAASAKLVFYDLSVLGGIVQVIAFMLCGVGLLAASAGRAKPAP